MRNSLKIAIMLFGSVFVNSLVLAGASSNNSLIAELKAPLSFKIESSIRFNLSSSKSVGDAQNTTLVFYNGSFLGNSGLYIPSHSGAITKDQITSILSELKSKPDAGLYCFMNLKPREALEIQGNSVVQDPIEMNIKSCYVKEAVSKVEGNTVSNFSFSAFGKSNEISMHFCELENSKSEEQSDIAGEIGCIAYKSNKQPKVSDFLSALNLRSNEIFVGDVRSNELIQKDQERIAEENREKASIRAEEEKKRIENNKELDKIAKNYEQQVKEDEKFFKTMPKVNDPKYLAIVKDHPEVGTLHSDCTFKTLTRDPKATEDCAKFKEAWSQYNK